MTSVNLAAGAGVVVVPLAVDYGTSVRHDRHDLRLPVHIGPRNRRTGATSRSARGPGAWCERCT
ncbi:hypothetical protein [Actinophytocola sp.]|uniref:hypothetical protein n=1 Tax=Actinophytocola sp. TaxID=1872138 RepID=UPI002EDB9101